MENLVKCTSWRETFTDVAQIYIGHGCQGKIHSSVLSRNKCLKVDGHHVCVTPHMDTYIYIKKDTLYPYIYIHMTTHHTLYILTVMDPYTHILCLPLTFSCQMTFISGSFEVMNCVCPFLIMDYMDYTTISDTEQVSQYGHRDDDKWRELLRV